MLAFDGMFTCSQYFRCSFLQGVFVLDDQHSQHLERLLDAMLDAASNSRFGRAPDKMVLARLAALLETMQPTLSRFQSPYVVMPMCISCNLRSPLFTDLFG
jgi:hypothetical protein